MKKYRNLSQHRKAHPKVFVWIHTAKAELEYFQDFKDHLKTMQLLPKKAICWSPCELIAQVVTWKKRDNIGKQEFSEEDGDQIWCVFDVDDFYKDEANKMLAAIQTAHKNKIKIAYSNECFELWILLHFTKPTAAIARGSIMENKIARYFKKHKLHGFTKNQKIFLTLLEFQPCGIKHANELIGNYAEIKWDHVLSRDGNPSTSIHFLIQEILSKFGNL